MPDTGLQLFLRNFAPDFCWCSVHDLLLITEETGDFDNMSENTFTATVSQLKTAGVFISRPDTSLAADKHNKNGRRGNLYLRVSH